MQHERNPLAARINALRLASAFVLAGFLVNAAVVVVIVAIVTKSTFGSLTCLAVMAAVIGGMAVVGEQQALRSAGARPLRPDEYPWLRPMIADLARKVGIAAPAVLISEDGAPNAFTMGTGRHTKISFTTGLLRLLPREQVRGVAAHEIGHVVNQDVVLQVWTSAVLSWVSFVGALVLTCAAAIFEMSRSLPDALDSEGELGLVVGFIVGAVGCVFAAFVWAIAQVWVALAMLVQLALTRQLEYLADATGAAITRDPRSLTRALNSLSQGERRMRGAAAVGPFCIVRPVASGGWWDNLWSTHPPPERRIEELDRLNTSELPTLGDSWRGVGPIAWLLPLGSVAALVLLVLSVPGMVPPTTAGPTNQVRGAAVIPNTSPAQLSAPGNPGNQGAGLTSSGIAPPLRNAAPQGVSPSTSPVQVSAPANIGNQAAVVVASVVPPAASSAPAQPEAPPTAKPVPTNTPVPPPSPAPPTPVPNTPPGTVLSPGQAWYQDGVALVLSKTALTPGWIDNWIACYEVKVDLRVHFTVQNLTLQPLAVTITGTNFKATMSNGTAMSLQAFDQCTTQGSVVINPSNSSDVRVSFVGDYTAPTVTFIELDVVGLGPFANAVWRIPVTH